MADVAVVGLGIMGRGMAANLLKGGHRVTVWNRSVRRTAEFGALGARVAATPREAAQGADVVFEVTADDASSRGVWGGDDGILAGARDGAVLITSATLSIAWVEELGALCAAGGFAFLDMPLTGGRAGAETGNLVLMTGGDAALLPGIRPVTDSIAAEVRHFGPVAAGTRAKLILNSVQAAHLAVFGEMIRLADAVGLDTAQMAGFLAERPGGGPTKLAAAAYESPVQGVSFATEWAAKDVEYAAAMTDAVDLPIIDEVRRVFAAALADGHAQDDWTVIGR